MKESGRIFRSEEVLAILDGRKTMFREPVILQSTNAGLEFCTASDGEFFAWQDAELNLDEWSEDGGPCQRVCPRGHIGDRIWVKETWGIHRDFETTARGIGFVGYRATEDKGCPHTLISKWRSSQSLPRWASRITLEIISVKVEKIQEITEMDAVKEGMDGHCPEDKMTWKTPREQFAEYWDSVYIKHNFGWDINPFVWCYEFERIINITL